MAPDIHGYYQTHLRGHDAASVEPTARTGNTVAHPNAPPATLYTLLRTAMRLAPTPQWLTSLPPASDHPNATSETPFAAHNSPNINDIAHTNIPFKTSN